MKRSITSTAAAVALVLTAVAPAGGAESPAKLERAADAAPNFDLPAVQMRIATGRALGEHAFLVIETMRLTGAGGDEFDAAAAALDDNTAEIEGLVAEVLTAPEARAFGQQWRNHIAYLVDYARAVEDGDEDARELAESQLHGYSTEFSNLLTDAFPNLPPDAVEELVGEHVAQLEQVTDLATGEYEAAYSAIRDTYAHMFTIGDGLVVGMASRMGDDLEGRDTAFSPAVDLRLTLDRLLGEHTYLAAFVMRASVEGAPHFGAALDALSANSRELAAQIEAIYGGDAAAAFSELWTRHTTDYLEYVLATRDSDEDAQETALDGLATYGSEFSSFLADANPHINADNLQALLEMHTHHLVDQVTAYSEGDYGAALATLRDGYAQTEDLATGLAGAIADQFPQMFPDTAAGRAQAPLAVERGLVTAGALLIVSALVALTYRRWGMLRE